MYDDKCISCYKVTQKDKAWNEHLFTDTGVIEESIKTTYSKIKNKTVSHTVEGSDETWTVTYKKEDGTEVKDVFVIESFCVTIHGQPIHL